MKKLIVFLLIIGGLVAAMHFSGKGTKLDVRVEKTLDASMLHLMGRLSDHANWDKFPGIDKSTVLKKGSLLIPNGSGAVRLIEAGPFTFKEEITSLTPRSMEYKIIESGPLHIIHEGGRIALTPQILAGKTQVVWTSKGEIDFPLIGGFLAKIMNPRLEESFNNILDAAAEKE